jgi:putative hydrolase of HD superfamily
MTAVIAFAMAGMETDVDREKLVALALVHDFAEARTGDLNYVQKQYVTALEDKAMADLTQGLVFGHTLMALMQEFNQGETLEARLANDADQLSFILELKKLCDTGAKSPDEWLPFVLSRLKTRTGKDLAQAIVSSQWDHWWRGNYSE